MEWDKLTARDFPAAIKASDGLCLFPVGCIEKHGDHMPLGTDAISAYAVSMAAAQREPAVVFPYYFLSVITEARHQPGTIAINSGLLLPLFENLCDEIGRNGFRKIVIVNFHGGNQPFLSFFGNLLLEKRKTYSVYVSQGWAFDRQKYDFPTVEQSCSHAGESETSLMMHLTPACVTCPAGAEEGRAQGRLQHLASARLSTGIDWYANYPHHFSGNGTPGSAEKGARFFDILVDNLATQIRAAKADQTVAALFREFHERSAAPAEAHSIPSVLPVTNSIWNGFPKQSFALQGTPAYVVRPQTAAPGNPWIWRTAWPDYHAEVDLELLRAGYHLGYVEVVDLLGADKALDIMDLFYAQVRSQWRLAEKPAVEPNSRGGLHAYRYAVRHPERVACILGDVPVMDFKSWPLQHPGSKDNWPQVIAAYGFRDDAEALAYKGNPIDQLEPIAKAKIPIRHVICLSDRVVPPEENTLEAKRRLQRMGWDIEVVAVPESQECEGHHFPYPEVGGSFQFVITHAGGCAQP